MSILTTLSNNPSLLISELDNYQKILDDQQDIFSLDGKRLEELCKVHPQNVFLFRKKAYNLKVILELFETKRDKVYGEIWKKLNENNKKILSQKDMGMYVQSDPDYILAQELVLQIAYMKQQFDAAVFALDSMGYALNNITKIRVASLEDIQI